MDNQKFIFDVETTGLPIRERNNQLNYKNLISFENCRIVSISWIITYNNNNNKYAILEKGNYYVKPDNFIISDKSTEIHGLTLEILNKKGIPIEEIFNKLVDIFNKNKITEIISHNIKFDINVLKSELVRYNSSVLLERINSICTFCTMLNSQKIMNVYKWPKLSEAYHYFYKKELQNAHDAEYDTLYCYNIYIAIAN